VDALMDDDARREPPGAAKDIVAEEHHDESRVYRRVRQHKPAQELPAADFDREIKDRLERRHLRRGRWTAAFGRSRAQSSDCTVVGLGEWGDRLLLIPTPERKAPA